MLPGFRFLFAAIVLSMSVLIFGLGAAALLRAAHEQFAHVPSRRAAPEPVFARLNEPPMPTLALLRVDQRTSRCGSHNGSTNRQNAVNHHRFCIDPKPHRTVNGRWRMIAAHSRQIR